WPLLRHVGIRLPVCIERNRGRSRLVQLEIYFLLLFPLEKPRARSAAPRRGLPRDLRVIVARLIFAEALEVAPVPSPRRLSRGHQRSVNRAVQNLPPPGAHVRLDSQRL